MDRPEWDEIWMTFAVHLSKRSTCQRASVGCVIVSDDNCRVLSMGYNGNYKGGKNICETPNGEINPGQCCCLHAEENAVIKLNYNDPSVKKLYTTTCPCFVCAKRIIQADISQVVYFNDYRKTEGFELLKKVGIDIHRYVGSVNDFNGDCA